jgi:TatD DNase family protein
LETDAPYLTPVPHRGERNEPAYLTYIAQRIAELRDVPTREISRATTENARRLFKKLLK